ncbi:MAG: hypothetical protein ABL958_01390 [Bdellovibrionia bacterium]
MKRQFAMVVGLAVVSSLIFVACGKKDDSPPQVQQPQCPPGYVVGAANGAYGYQNPYGNQYGNQYGYQGGYQYGYQGGYQNPYGNQYGNQYGYQNPYANPYAQNGVPVNCVPAPGVQPTPIPGTGTGTGTGTLPAPDGGVLGTIAAAVNLEGTVSTTNREMFNKFLKENSGRCNTGALSVLAGECNNYTSTGGYLVIQGSGSTVQGLVAAGPYTGNAAKGAYMPVSPITYQYFLVNSNQGFELRAMGYGGYGYAGILSIRAENVVLTNGTFNVILRYKPSGSSQFTEFGRATVRPR